MVSPPCLTFWHFIKVDGSMVLKYLLQSFYFSYFNISDFMMRVFKAFTCCTFSETHWDLFNEIIVQWFLAKFTCDCIQLGDTSGTVFVVKAAGCSFKHQDDNSVVLSSAESSL